MAKAPHQAKRCKVQGKVRYRTRATALHFAWSQADRPGYEKFRAYQCPHCKWWHITTKYATEQEKI